MSDFRQRFARPCLPRPVHVGHSVSIGKSDLFLHRDPCSLPEDLYGLPTQLTERQLSVRSFDPDEIMIDATVIDGGHLQATIERFFTAQRSHSIHVHNATRGCWAVTVARA